MYYLYFVKINDLKNKLYVTNKILIIFFFSSKIIIIILITLVTNIWFYYRDILSIFILYNKYVG